MTKKYDWEKIKKTLLQQKIFAPPFDSPKILRLFLAYWEKEYEKEPKISGIISPAVTLLVEGHSQDLINQMIENILNKEQLIIEGKFATNKQLESITPIIEIPEDYQEILEFYYKDK